MQQAAPGNGDFVTPTIVGAGEYDYAPARPALHQGDVRAADQRQGVRRPQQGDHGRVALDVGAAVHSSPPATLQPLWSQPDVKPPRFEDGLDRAKSRFSGILSELGLNEPKELTQ